MRLLLCFWPLAALTALAQTAPDTAPTFEVASVKVAAPVAPIRGGSYAARGCGKSDPTMLRCNGATLRALLMRAYNVKSYQVEGPAWIGAEGYDVMAKVPEGVPADKIPAMLQALLAERFAVKLHQETRELPAYELTVAKGGPKLKATDTDKLPDQAPAPRISPGGRNIVPPPVSSMPAGAMMVLLGPTSKRMVRGNMTIEQLANYLTTALERPVFDRTDLKGTFAIDLSYRGDETGLIGRMNAENGTADGSVGQDGSLPTANVFQALQETLGLKLEAKKAPGEMIVVESARKVPTQN